MFFNWLFLLLKNQAASRKKSADCLTDFLGNCSLRIVEDFFHTIFCNQCARLSPEIVKVSEFVQLGLFGQVRLCIKVRVRGFDPTHGVSLCF